MWQGHGGGGGFFFLFFSAKSLFLSVLTLSRSRLAPELGWVCGLIWAWWWARIG